MKQLSPLCVHTLLRHAHWSSTQRKHMIGLQAAKEWNRQNPQVENSFVLSGNQTEEFNPGFQKESASSAHPWIKQTEIESVACIQFPVRHITNNNSWIENMLDTCQKGTVHVSPGHQEKPTRAIFLVPKKARRRASLLRGSQWWGETSRKSRTVFNNTGRTTENKVQTQFTSMDNLFTQCSLFLWKSSRHKLTHYWTRSQWNDHYQPHDCTFIRHSSLYFCLYAVYLISKIIQFSYTYQALC